jgi:hypothetical protein
MPEVVDCAGPQFQFTHVDIFGAEIPIAACMADQVSLGFFKVAKKDELRVKKVLFKSILVCFRLWTWMLQNW